MHFILVLILGIIIGSFLNVCIYRIPKEESIVFPPSHCTYCSQPLKWYDLIPIFSYLSLNGKCRYCGGAISPRYPFVELLNGLLYLLLFYYFGLSLNFVFYALITSILIVISFIDYDTLEIPDGLVLGILVLTVANKFISHSIYKTPFYFLDSLWGFLAGGLIFLAIAIVSKGAMGGGDIKLVSVLGFILGLKKTLLHIFLSFLIGAIFSLCLLLSGKKGRKDAIPFGPFINIAFIIVILYGNDIINWYITKFVF